MKRLEINRRSGKQAKEERILIEYGGKEQGEKGRIEIIIKTITQGKCLGIIA